MQAYEASCHCGNIEATFETPYSLGELGVRSCDCSFCSKHNARVTSDPAGRLSIRVRDPEKLNRYSFAMKTVEFLVCRTCGAYVAAIFPDGQMLFGILNLNALTDRQIYLPNAVMMNFDGENEGERRQRRKTRWTPVTELKLGGVT